MDILPEMPEIVRQYALYYRNIKGRAPKTVNEYCSDLRTFFRFMKHFRGYVSQDTPMEEIQSTILTLNLSVPSRQWTFLNS